MPTRTYDQLLALVQALCGITFAAIELPRIKALINRHAFNAYRSSNFWMRFVIVGEERATVTDTVTGITSIPYVDTGLTLPDVDTFIRLHRTRPYGNVGAQEFDYHVGSNGANLISGSLNPASVFVTYKKANSAQSGSTQYGSDAGDTTEIPLEWFQYIAHASYADFLRSEGQQEKSGVADQEAQMFLQEELYRIDQQRTSGVIGTKICTNSNYQLR